MGITRNYSPMALAMNLASQAGAGAGARINQAADMDFMQLTNQMQAQANQRRAQEMQLALQYKQMDNAQANRNIDRSLQNDAALRDDARADSQLQLQRNGQQFNQGMQTRQADTQDGNLIRTADLQRRDQQMQEGDYSARRKKEGDQDAALERIGNGKATDADYFLFGKTPPSKGGRYSNPDEIKAVDALRQNLAELRIAQKELAAHTYDAAKMDIADKRVAQAKDGHGWLYEDAQRKVADIQGRIDTYNSMLTAPGGQPQAGPAAAPAPAGAMQQKTAPVFQNGQMQNPNAAAAGPAGAGAAPAQPVTPEIQAQLLEDAAQSLGRRPSDVAALPPAPAGPAAEFKAWAVSASSDPIMQRRLFYSKMIQSGFNPLLRPAQPVQAQPLRPQLMTPAMR